MLKIQQVKRLALQNAQGSQAEGVAPGSAAVVGGLRLSASVAFGTLECAGLEGWGAVGVASSSWGGSRSAGVERERS